MNAADRTRGSRELCGEPVLNASPVFPFYYCINNGYLAQEMVIGTSYDLIFVWGGAMGKTLDGDTNGNEGDWGTIVGWSTNCGAAGDELLIIQPRSSRNFDSAVNCNLELVVPTEETIHPSLLSGVTYKLRITPVDADNLNFKLFQAQETAHFAESTMTVTDLFATGNPIFYFGYPPIAIIERFVAWHGGPANADLESLKVVSLMEMGT